MAFGPAGWGWHRTRVGLRLRTQSIAHRETSSSPAPEPTITQASAIFVQVKYWQNVEFYAGCYDANKNLILLQNITTSNGNCRFRGCLSELDHHTQSEWSESDGSKPLLLLDKTKPAQFPASVLRLVAVIHPFERERAVLNQDRLLAIIDSHLAIFGTVVTVRVEIDRYLDQTPADASIAQKLGLLGSEDETWCLVSSLALNTEIGRVLNRLDPAFSGVGEGDTLLFGIRYRQRVEIEFVTNTAIPAQTGQAHALAKSMFRSENDAAAPDVHVVKIDKGRYDRRLEALIPR